MSRSWKSTFNTIRSIQSEIVRAFEDAAKGHWTHQQLLDWRDGKHFTSKGIYGRPDYQTLPRWAMCEIAGTWWVMEHLMWRDKLVFTYLHYGTRYALGTPEYRAVPVRDIDTDTGAYAWKDDINALFTKPGRWKNDTEHQQNPGPSVE